MITFFPSCTGAWIIKKVKFVTLSYIYSFMVAFVVRFSNILFCDIWSWFSTQNYPLIVTVIVYGVPSIEVFVFIWVIILLGGHIILKG